MTQEDLRHWLALNLLFPLLSSRRSYQLLQYYGSPDGVFAAGEKSWLEQGLSEQAVKALSSPNWYGVEQALCWAEKPGNHVVTFDSEYYPSLLKEISDPPLVLYCQGDPKLLQQHQLAIVGSRNPTPSGYETAHAFAMQLAKTGFVITSGLAIGIDGAAHRGALQAECNTIAVTGSGLDRIYPARHQELAERIRQNGLLISEFPLGSAPIGRHFPMRNRIISGLSHGVLIVEAALRSGSLITARQALEQGREVFAVPGSIHHPNTRGCHALLRQGAKLVETVDDVLEELENIISIQPVYARKNSIQVPDLPEGDYHRVLSAVDMAPASVDHIVQRCGLTADEVCSMLLKLELSGYVYLSSDGLYSRTV
jgi:DNA processing protein